MGHLYRLRVGWEGERLAHYLLSRFSFVAQPTTIADDVGSDFYCTIFQVLGTNPPTVQARTSFAIQVKSNAKRVNAHNKVQYLASLEIPYFLGVVDQKEAKLKIYSAEHFPMMAATCGLRSKLWLRPVQDNAKPHWDDVTDPDGLTLNCYYVCSFNASEGRHEIGAKVADLLSLCSRATNNIGSRRAEEHIYDYDTGSVILAGPGSATHFRDNLYKRLAEAFHNFIWILKAEPEKFRREEFEIYERFFLALTKMGLVPPPSLKLVNASYVPLRQVVDRLADQTIPSS